MRLSFIGSSLLSSYWNGAATYYRGIVSGLSRLGVRTTFYEPDAYGRQQHRDIDPPSWAEVVVWEPTPQRALEVCREALRADVVVKASGIGVLDDEIAAAIVCESGDARLRLFWDVDAPATLAAMDGDPEHVLRRVVPRLDGVLTYGGGPPVVRRYTAFGAKRCVPVYNALDPETHFRVPPEPRFAADLAFLGNRLPDREARVGTFFIEPARQLPSHRFLLAGSGWEAGALPGNIRVIGHLSTRDHNAFNSTPRAVINIARDSMAETGFSPATRVFEAAGAGACIITDAWEGIEQFLTPGVEVLVARDGADVVRLVRDLSPSRAHEIGENARQRILREHTYDLRARQVADLLRRWQSGAVPMEACS
jgi:spore maturation protein CgeB